MDHWWRMECAEMSSSLCVMSAFSNIADESENIVIIRFEVIVERGSQIKLVVLNSPDQYRDS
jgi:hypothetical protein